MSAPSSRSPSPKPVLPPFSAEEVVQPVIGHPPTSAAPLAASLPTPPFGSGNLGSVTPPLPHTHTHHGAPVALLASIPPLRAVPCASASACVLPSSTSGCIDTLGAVPRASASVLPLEKSEAMTVHVRKRRKKNEMVDEKESGALCACY